MCMCVVCTCDAVFFLFVYGADLFGSNRCVQICSMSHVESATSVCLCITHLGGQFVKVAIACIVLVECICVCVCVYVSVCVTPDLIGQLVEVGIGRVVLVECISVCVCVCVCRSQIYNPSPRTAACRSIRFLCSACHLRPAGGADC